MPKFLNTKGRSTLAVAICQRCSMKMARADMVRDPDTRLMVHAHCADEPDPWRLPPRRPESMAVKRPFPDSPIDKLPTSGVTGPQPLPTFPPPGETPDDPGQPQQPSGPGDFGNDFGPDFS